MLMREVNMKAHMWHSWAMADSFFVAHAQSLSQRALVALNENGVVEHTCKHKYGV